MQNRWVQENGAVEEGRAGHARRWRAADSMKSSGAHPALLLAQSGTVCARERLCDLYVPITGYSIVAYAALFRHRFSSIPSSGTSTP